jgi:hypothetical protein
MAMNKMDILKLTDLFDKLAGKRQGARFSPGVDPDPFRIRDVLREKGRRPEEVTPLPGDILEAQIKDLAQKVEWSRIQAERTQGEEHMQWMQMLQEQHAQLQALRQQYAEMHKAPMGEPIPAPFLPPEEVPEQMLLSPEVLPGPQWHDYKPAKHELSKEDKQRAQREKEQKEEERKRLAKLLAGLGVEEEVVPEGSLSKQQIIDHLISLVWGEKPEAAGAGGAALPRVGRPARISDSEHLENLNKLIELVEGELDKWELALEKAKEQGAEDAFITMGEKKGTITMFLEKKIADLEMMMAKAVRDRANLKRKLGLKYSPKEDEWVEVGRPEAPQADPTALKESRRIGDKRMTVGEIMDATRHLPDNPEELDKRIGKVENKLQFLQARQLDKDDEELIEYLTKQREELDQAMRQAVRKYKNLEKKRAIFEDVVDRMVKKTGLSREEIMTAARPMSSAPVRITGNDRQELIRAYIRYQRPSEMLQDKVREFTSEWRNMGAEIKVLELGRTAPDAVRENIRRRHELLQAFDRMSHKGFSEDSMDVEIDDLKRKMDKTKDPAVRKSLSDLKDKLETARATVEGEIGSEETGQGIKRVPRVILEYAEPALVRTKQKLKDTLAKQAKEPPEQQDKWEEEISKDKSAVKRLEGMISRAKLRGAGDTRYKDYLMSLYMQAEDVIDEWRRQSQKETAKVSNLQKQLDLLQAKKDFLIQRPDVEFPLPAGYEEHKTPMDLPEGLPGGGQRAAPDLTEEGLVVPPPTGGGLPMHATKPQLRKTRETGVDVAEKIAPTYYTASGDPNTPVTPEGIRKYLDKLRSRKGMTIDKFRNEVRRLAEAREAARPEGFEGAMPEHPALYHLDPILSIDFGSRNVIESTRHEHKGRDTIHVVEKESGQYEVVNDLGRVYGSYPTPEAAEHAAEYYRKILGYQVVEYKLKPRRAGVTVPEDWRVLVHETLLKDAPPVQQGSRATFQRAVRQTDAQGKPTGAVEWVDADPEKLLGKYQEELELIGKGVPTPAPASVTSTLGWLDDLYSKKELDRSERRDGSKTIRYKLKSRTKDPGPFNGMEVVVHTAPPKGDLQAPTITGAEIVGTLRPESDEPVTMSLNDALLESMRQFYAYDWAPPGSKDQHFESDPGSTFEVKKLIPVRYVNKMRAKIRRQKPNERNLQELQDLVEEFPEDKNPLSKWRLVTQYKRSSQVPTQAPKLTRNEGESVAEFNQRKAEELRNYRDERRGLIRDQYFVDTSQPPSLSPLGRRYPLGEGYKQIAMESEQPAAKVEQVPHGRPFEYKESPSKKIERPDTKNMEVTPMEVGELPERLKARGAVQARVKDGPDEFETLLFQGPRPGLTEIWVRKPGGAWHTLTEGMRPIAAPTLEGFPEGMRKDLQQRLVDINVSPATVLEGLQKRKPIYDPILRKMKAFMMPGGENIIPEPRLMRPKPEAETGDEPRFHPDREDLGEAEQKMLDTLQGDIRKRKAEIAKIKPKLDKLENNEAVERWLAGQPEEMREQLKNEYVRLKARTTQLYAENEKDRRQMNEITKGAPLYEKGQPEEGGEQPMDPGMYRIGIEFTDQYDGRQTMAMHLQNPTRDVEGQEQLLDKQEMREIIEEKVLNLDWLTPEEKSDTGWANLKLKKQGVTKSGRKYQNVKVRVKLTGTAHRVRPTHKDYARQGFDFVIPIDIETGKKIPIQDMPQ